MATRPSVIERLRHLGPVFRSKNAVAAGVAWRDLYALRDDGQVLELSRGLYQLAEAAGTGNLDFVVVCARAPHGMVCLNSALAYWDLSDEGIPPAVHLAVPDGSHRPAIDHPPARIHVFRASTFNLGRLEVTLERGKQFWITDRERTVVDAFRLRHLIGGVAPTTRSAATSAPDRNPPGLRNWPGPCGSGTPWPTPSGSSPDEQAEPGHDRQDRVYLDLQAEARRTGRPTDELFVLYTLERFLFRLSLSPLRRQFVLKGGMLLAALDERRAT